ncbi:MAG: hypothetical protein V1934_07625 [Methanobacteriota archaeon]
MELLNKRNCIIAMAALFVVLAAAVASSPYDPMNGDKADATTNYIWTRYYSEGVYHVTWEQWRSDWGALRTQSSVVTYGGDLVVVNEKGPGHAMMIVPFYLLGIEPLFGPILAALAVLATFLLGRRLVNWKVGLVASASVLANLTYIAMWHRYYWTDASTMHLLVVSLWLFVEALYHSNGRSLDPRSTVLASRRDLVTGAALGAISGLAFGGAVSTRYPAALVGIAMPCYLAAFFLAKVWPDLRIRKLVHALKSLRSALFALAFIAGLLVVLVPLMQYNSAYFGGPFNSGYDADSLMGFNPDAGLAPRNATASWTSSLIDGASNALDNAFLLAPILVVRMPALLLAPLGIWYFRRNLAAALLIPWLLIAFFTYLSLSWVSMYARIDLVPWEPRYFMPAIPAIGILAGAALDHHGFKSKVPWRKLAAILAVGGIVLVGVAPALAYLGGPQQDGARPGGAPPQQVLNATTDQLLISPREYAGSFVHISDARVTLAAGDAIQVRSFDATNPGSVAVHFVDWPPGTLPQIETGDRVDAQGMFARPPGGTLQTGYVLTVKYGTADYVRVVGQAP